MPAGSLSLGKGEKGGSPAKGGGRELLLVAPIMPMELTPSPTSHPAWGPLSLSHIHASSHHPAVSKAAHSSQTFSPSITHTHTPPSSVVLPLAHPITHTHPH